MSAAQRVSRAAGTIRARWERGVTTDPQSDAAQALDDAGMLLDPEVADELAALRRAREESPLGSERLAEIRSLDLLVMMSDRSAAVVGRALGDLLDEVERLRSRVAELEDVERRLLALLPTEPCIEYGLPNDLAAAEAEYGAWQQVAEVLGARLPYTRTTEDVTPQVRKLRALLAGQRAAQEDPHDSPLHHDYRVSRDLPETGGESQ